MNKKNTNRRENGTYFSLLDWSDLRELYIDKQLSVNDIAELKGCAPSCVCTNMKRQKILARKPSEFTENRKRMVKTIYKNRTWNTNAKYNYDVVLNKDVLNELYVRKSLSVKQIAEIYDCGYSTIKSRLLRYNIPLQNMSENNPSKRPDVVKKMSEGSKRFWDNHPEQKIIQGKNMERTWTKHRLFFMERAKEWRKNLVVPKKDTSIEVKVQGQLRELGYDFFTHQYMSEITHSYQCDIFIPSLNLVIECDGMYWHKYPVGRNIDHVRTSELITKGFKVLRLWEIEIKQMSADDLKKKISAFEGGYDG